MATETQLQERAIFFIDRRIAELETAEAKHEEFANSGVSYAERRRIEAGLAEKREKNATELETWQWVRKRLTEG